MDIQTTDFCRTLASIVYAGEEGRDQGLLPCGEQPAWALVACGFADWQDIGEGVDAEGEHRPYFQFIATEEGKAMIAALHGTSTPRRETPEPDHADYAELQRLAEAAIPIVDAGLADGEGELPDALVEYDEATHPRAVLSLLDELASAKAELAVLLKPPTGFWTEENVVETMEKGDGTSTHRRASHPEPSSHTEFRTMVLDAQARGKGFSAGTVLSLLAQVEALEAQIAALRAARPEPASDDVLAELERRRDELSALPATQTDSQWVARCDVWDAWRRDVAAAFPALAARVREAEGALEWLVTEFASFASETVEPACNICQVLGAGEDRTQSGSPWSQLLCIECIRKEALAAGKEGGK
jgi:hypothetical protein